MNTMGKRIYMKRTENGMTIYSYEGITYTDYCSPSIYYILYNEETPYHR